MLSTCPASPGGTVPGDRPPTAHWVGGPAPSPQPLGTGKPDTAGTPRRRKEEAAGNGDSDGTGTSARVALTAPMMTGAQGPSAVGLAGQAA